MRYYATASGPKVRDAMTRGLLGQIASPLAGNRVLPGVEWCGDNNAFGDNYPGDAAFLTWIGKRRRYADRCRFITAPDVLCDAAATLERSAPMLPAIRRLGFRVAFVAQNGLEDLVIPWPSFDALFIGGDTTWKLGAHVRALVSEARHHGKWVHMGRVNSWERLREAWRMGCDSADGTYLAKGPDKNLPRLLHWMRVLDVHPRPPRRAPLPQPTAAGQTLLWEVV